MGIRAKKSSGPAAFGVWLLPIVVVSWCLACCCGLVVPGAALCFVLVLCLLCVVMLSVVLCCVL